MTEMHIVPASEQAQAFDNPVFESQSVFRAILQTLSRPGEQASLGLRPEFCDVMPAGLAAIALTLADYETPIWLDEALAGDDRVERFLVFHAGAPLTKDTSKAAFALAVQAAQLPDFERFAIGTLEYPDRSTTLIVEVEALEGGPALLLEGPGINGRVVIAPQGLPTDFSDRLKRNRALFPRGIDIILVAGQAIVGLPRSIQIVE